MNTQGTTLEKMYPLGDCYKLLNINQKTLDKWLKESGIVPEVGKSDYRVRSISYAQLVQLAEKHGRLLKDVAQIEKELPVSPGAYKLLLDRVDALEKELQRVPDRLQEQEQNLLQQAVEQQEKALSTLQDAFTQQINELSKMLTKQQEEQEKLIEQITDQQQKITRLNETLQTASTHLEEQQQTLMQQEQQVVTLSAEIEAVKRENKEQFSQERTQLDNINKEVKALQNRILDDKKPVQEQQTSIEQEKPEVKKKRSSRPIQNKETTNSIP